VFTRVDALKQRKAIRKKWVKTMNLENSKTKKLFPPEGKAGIHVICS
jgi:hypothetical protein